MLLSFKIFERAKNHGKKFPKLCQTSFSGIINYCTVIELSWRLHTGCIPERIRKCNQKTPGREIFEISCWALTMLWSRVCALSHLPTRRILSRQVIFPRLFPYRLLRQQFTALTFHHMTNIVQGLTLRTEKKRNWLPNSNYSLFILVTCILLQRISNSRDFVKYIGGNTSN